MPLARLLSAGGGGSGAEEEEGGEEEHAVASRFQEVGAHIMSSLVCACAHVNLICL